MEDLERLKYLERDVETLIHQYQYELEELIKRKFEIEHFLSHLRTMMQNHKDRKNA